MALLAVAASLSGLALASVAFVAAQVHRIGRRAPALHPRDAIVVLGARVLPDGRPSEALTARVEHAVGLHRAGLGRWLVFSGAGSGPAPEAVVAKRLALEAGAPEAACVLEADSASTFDNARRTASVLEARQVRSVWLVTDDFHVLRALAHFRRLRVDVEAAPVRRVLSPGRRVYWTVREALAVVRRPWLLR
ncbi:MAG: YdcF family protein [Myxococcaceae bacterium]|nr:YdcF family protein [Myxococcaceae bacterium]